MPYLLVRYLFQQEDQPEEWRVAGPYDLATVADVKRRASAMVRGDSRCLEVKVMLVDEGKGPGMAELHLWTEY